jgi:hypothetical protein
MQLQSPLERDKDNEIVILMTGEVASFVHKGRRVLSLQLMEALMT